MNYLRSGLYAKPPALPGPETEIGLILVERRASLIADLGGIEACTTAQLGLVELALRTWCLLDAADAFLLSLPSIVDKRHRRVWQVVRDRSAMATQLQSLLRDLGLERRAKPVLDLQSYIAARDRD